MDVELIPDLAGVDPQEWDRLCGDSDPFVEHGFLRTLETSGSVGGRSGWHPVHVIVRDGGKLAGALPLYAKSNSYGEYIFDWSWASAAARAGIEYYPKLVSMAPFTPATGQRLLVHPEADRAAVVKGLVAGSFGAAEEIKASSLHLLFLTEGECRELTDEVQALRPRLSSQFHWHNEGYASFDDFLQRFRSSLRKQVRRERKRANGAGLDIQVKAGDEITKADWLALSRFYRDTCMKRGSGPYLTSQFFEQLPEVHGHRAVAVLAYEAGEPVAGTLNFQKGKHLYGRYWGCFREYDCLHFELCYYRLIERAIEQGLTRFEAGAQGTHKLRRGLMPVAIHSAHWIGHPGLAEAIGDYLPREAAAVRGELMELSMHGPFRRGDDSKANRAPDG